MWLTDLLATFHVLFAMSWLGGGIMFGFIIGPQVARIPPPATREFFVNVGPAVLRFFQVVPTLTIAFGLLLVYNMTGGDWSQLSPATSWGFDVSVGMTFAIAAFVVGEAGAAPALGKVVRLLKSFTPGSGAPPPAELPAAVRNARVTATVSILLLGVTMVFMVGAGFY